MAKIIEKGFAEKINDILDPIAPPESQNLPAKPVPAGVIVPIVINENDFLFSELLLTLRTSEVKDHKGQVSFPGGVCEKRDENLLETAIRETFEEIGIEKSLYKIAGMLKPYTTVTGYTIFPFVGLLDKKPPVKANPIEIEKVFYAPLGIFMDSSKIEEGNIVFRNQNYFIKGVRWEGMLIWGATYNIIMDLVERLKKFPGK